MTYGGNEEIVLKGPKARKSQKAGKDGRVTEPKNVYAQRSSGILCQNTDSYRSRMGVCCCDVGQREYNIYKGQKKYPWSGSYSFWKRQSKEIS
jgi:hypothetical protein